MVSHVRHAVCRQCGAANIGTQTHCLLCQALLPAAEMPQEPEPSQPASPGYRFCTQCGTRLEEGKRFCTNCGHRF